MFMLRLSTATVLLAGFAISQVPQANYPLLTDLNDTTTLNGPVMLTGNPTPPAAPANGVCVNGVYARATGGQDIITPLISTLDATDFQLDVEFKLDAMPATTRGAPVIMGGRGWRWIGIYVQQNGTVGVKYNNSSFSWSSKVLTTNTWYSAVVKFETDTVRLYIDGVPVHRAVIGTLTTGNNLNFTTNDYSVGLNHNGCIRNLRLWNDTDIDAGLFTRYPDGCAGLTITESGTPNIGSTFTLANGGPGSSSSSFLVGLSRVGVKLCAVSCVLGSDSVLTVPGATLSVPIPTTASLVDSVVYFQGITITTGGCFLLTMTDTLAVTVGK